MRRRNGRLMTVSIKSHGASVCNTEVSARSQHERWLSVLRSRIEISLLSRPIPKANGRWARCGDQSVKRKQPMGARGGLHEVVRSAGDMAVYGESATCRMVII